MPRTALAIREGMPVKAIAHDIMEDRPIMNVIVPVIFAESRMIFGRSVTLMER